jgi:Putative zinc-finger
VSCRFAHDDAAYVLGALSPGERLAFERHLPGCAECTEAVRRFAGLPGLLSRVEPSLLEELMAEEPVPDTLLPFLSRRVGRSRRRRTALGLGLAAAAAVVAGAVPFVVGQLGDEGSPAAAPGSAAAPSPSAPLTLDPVGEVPVRASVVMEQVLWGTRLDLTCTYDPGSVDDELPPAADYALFVSTHDGRTEQVGSWRSLGGRTMHLSAATAASRGDIASVEVRTLDGRVLLKLTG